MKYYLVCENCQIVEDLGNLDSYFRVKDVWENKAVYTRMVEDLERVISYHWSSGKVQYDNESDLYNLVEFLKTIKEHNGHSTWIFNESMEFNEIVLPWYEIIDGESKLKSDWSICDGVGD